MDGRFTWLENIRAIACLMVVILHVSAIYVVENQGWYWNIGNIFDSFTRICVPIFFMISGYLFFSDKEIKFKNYIRLVTPLVFYSIVAFFYFSITSQSYSFNILKSPAYYHLWYFYPLIAIYIISGLIKVRSISFNKILITFLFVFIIFNPKINDVVSNIFNFSLSNYFFIYGDFFYYLMYGVLGGLLRHSATTQLDSNLIKKIAPITFVISSLSTTYLTYITYTNENYGYPFYAYNGPLVFISAMSCFLFIKESGVFSKSNKFLKLISDNSLAIYCIHAFILNILLFLFKYNDYNPLIMIPLVFTLILSLIFSLGVRKIDKKGYIS